jgi:RNA polymerase sigma factor (sigma-70 family)
VNDTSTGMINRVQAGDHQAWSQFANRCAVILEQWGLWKGLQPADAEDLSQDALLVVLSKINAFRHTGRGSLRAWLRAIAWRCLCQVRGRNAPQSDPELLEMYLRSEEQIMQLEEDFDRLQQMQLLSDAMQLIKQRVRDRTWEAFRLTAIEHLPGPEAAQQLQMHVDAVYAAKLRVQRLVSTEIRRRQNSRPTQD